MGGSEKKVSRKRSRSVKTDEQKESGDVKQNTKATKKTKLNRPALDSNWKSLLGNGTVRLRKVVVDKDDGKEKKEDQKFPVIDWTKKTATSKETKIVAIDCEMVGIGPVDESALARVCLVNEDGHVLLDTFVKPLEAVTNYRTEFSGVRPSDLVKAPKFVVVQDLIRKYVRGKILVGHSLKNDFKVLFIKHPLHAVRDTALFHRFRIFSEAIGKTVPAKLRHLAAKELGANIQDGEHDPYIDARAALELYKKYQDEWEKEVTLNRSEKRKKRELYKATKKSNAVVAQTNEPEKLATSEATANGQYLSRSTEVKDIFTKKHHSKNKKK